MKKKIVGGLLVLAIAAVAAFNLNLNSEDSGFSLLSLANVEALAGEGNGGYLQVECHTIKAYDPVNNTMVEEIQKICTGNGPLSCEC